MRHFVTYLSRLSGMRRLAQILRLHRLGNWWLHRFPLTKRLPHSNVVYRATRLESIPLAVEMFEGGNLYTATLLPKGFTTFVDLGCNVGYFTCWLAHLAHERKLKGLMLDANPDAVVEAEWHAKVNQMQDVIALHGIVGEGTTGEMVEFFLYESNICSTSHLPDTVKSNLKGEWTKISVPCVNIEAIWRQHFAGTRCHVLKIDIEGSEMNFLRTEQSFLQLVDSVLIEWHKWSVAFQEIEEFLAEHGFYHAKTIDESEAMGTAFFLRDGPRVEINGTNTPP
jgi:FkbM family methyltransferase